MHLPCPGDWFQVAKHNGSWHSLEAHKADGYWIPSPLTKWAASVLYPWSQWLCLWGNPRPRCGSTHAGYVPSHAGPSGQALAGSALAVPSWWVTSRRLSSVARPRMHCVYPVSGVPLSQGGLLRGRGARLSSYSTDKDRKLRDVLSPL